MIFFNKIQELAIFFLVIIKNTKFGNENSKVFNILINF